MSRITPVTCRSGPGARPAFWASYWGCTLGSFLPMVLGAAVGLAAPKPNLIAGLAQMTQGIAPLGPRGVLGGRRGRQCHESVLRRAVHPDVRADAVPALVAGGTCATVIGADSVPGVADRRAARARRPFWSITRRSSCCCCTCSCRGRRSIWSTITCCGAGNTMWPRSFARTAGSTAASMCAGRHLLCPGDRGPAAVHRLGAVHRAGGARAGRRRFVLDRRPGGDLPGVLLAGAADPAGPAARPVKELRAQSC